MEDRIVTLSNGKRVANFSSPHSFTFTDGSVLPSVGNEMAMSLQVNFIEKVYDNGDVELSFALSASVLEEMRRWFEIWENGKVDVVIVPLPMLTALYNNHSKEYVRLCTPFRAVRIEDRIKKLLSIEKQCL